MIIKTSDLLLKKKKKFLLFNNRYDGRQKVMTFLIKKYTQYKNVNIPK